VIRLTIDVAYLCIKFDDFSCSRYDDEDPKIYNDSCDHDHAPFSGMTSVDTDLLWLTYLPNLKSLSSVVTKIGEATQQKYTRRPASADRTVRAVNFRRDLEAT